MVKKRKGNTATATRIKHRFRQLNIDPVISENNSCGIDAGTRTGQAGDAKERKTKNRSALINPVTRRSGPTHLGQEDRPDKVNRRTCSDTNEAPGHRTAKGPACISHNGEAAPG